MKGLFFPYSITTNSIPIVNPLEFIVIGNYFVKLQSIYR